MPQLQIDPDVQQDIITAVGTGKTVVVSAREVVRETWSGVGYIIQDPATGAGAYLIQGGVRGGEEDPCREDSLEPEPNPISDIIFVLSLFILLVALTIAFAELLPVWAAAAAGGAALVFDAAPIVAWPIPTNEQGLWNALFAQRFGPLLTQPPFPGDGLGQFGTCTEGYVSSFETIIHAACDEQGGSGKCRTAARAKDCPAAAQFARNEVTCIELRLQLMFTCFNGGDGVHWGQVSQRLRGLFRCICLMDINGCPPAFLFR